MEKKTKKRLMTAAVLGTVATAGYMYMKKNPNAVDDMKEAAKNIAKATYNKLEDID